MHNRIIFGTVIVIITTCLFTSCSDNNYMKFPEQILPKYSKEEECEYSYNITGNKITINSKISDLKITKSDISEIKINMKKAVGAEREDNLQKALDNIKCTYENDVINIGPENDDKSLVNSRNIQTTISIPNDITSLDITSGVGDIKLEGNYDDLKAEMKTGDLSYKGELKQGNIYSDVGSIKLNLQRLDSSYKYSINGRVGDVRIMIPKENSINLTASTIKDATIGDGIKFDNSSATFDINKKVAHVKIENES
ncbi:DUF4097 domain-containing protein [Clostridium sp. ZS1]|uniref:DUF4097 domain-containing protein n=1 Tax=Clostridium sp. ZS1 TaxID=2949989 RepID=UPI00207A16B1|nr:DUF4097 domain-containing protein [Clostridium sp. ZS1]